MVSRAAELVQLFLAEKMTEEEAAELLAIWSRRPDLEAYSQANYYTEQVFLLDGYSKVFLSPILLQKLKRTALEQFGISTVGETSSQQQEPFSFHSFDMDELLRLAAESPAITIDRPKRTTPPRKKKSEPKSKQDWPAPFRPFRILLLLFVVLVVGGIYLSFRNNQTKNNGTPFNAVARIVDSVEAEWEDDAESFKTGQDMEMTALKLRSGVVRLEFGNGAEVTLEGPTELLVKNQEMAFCKQGKLSVFVPPRGKGFEIATPTATVVDLGTAFSMLVSEEASEVHVIKGKVKVGKTGRATQLLTDGMASLCDIRNESKVFAAVPTTFFSEENLQERKAEYVAKRQSVWNEQEAKQKSDPSLLYRLAPETVTDLARTEGSREGKTAVRFRDNRDRIPVSVGGEYQSLTMMASIRLDRLTGHSHTLFMGDSFNTTAAGGFHWQLSRLGVMQIHLNYGKSGLRRFDSPPVLQRKDLGTWIFTAVVLDAENRKITHFLNGSEAASFSWNNPISLNLDRATLGNEQLITSKPTDRSFKGDMEDFMIFSKALSPTEIKNFYLNHQ